MREIDRLALDPEGFRLTLAEKLPRDAQAQEPLARYVGTCPTRLVAWAEGGELPPPVIRILLLRCLHRQN